MVNKRIAIIGAGQIGSRHLQALALIDREVSIQVLDTSSTALTCAQERYNQIIGIKAHSVEYLMNISELAPDLDVVIVATSADIRRKVIEELLSIRKVRYLIMEKIVFQNPSDFSFVEKLLRTHGVQAWVNCPRRMWPFYQELKKKFQGAQSFDYTVSGSGRGLIGCNGIHFLDHFTFLTGQTDITLWPTLLDKKILESPRQGFVEFSGTLYGVSTSGYRISLSSYSHGNAPILIVLNSDKVRCLIREEEGKAWIAEADQAWNWHEVAFATPYQSQLTHLAVQQILDQGKCSLTEYAESWKLHIPLLNALMEHLRQQTEEEITVCPIT